VSTLFKPELLTEIPLSKIGSYIKNPAYGMQEKHNGKRRVIIKEGNTVYCLNKEGVRRDVPLAIVAGIRKLPVQNLIIDTEMMDVYHVRISDILRIDELDLTFRPYSFRYSIIEQTFQNMAWGKPSPMAVTEDDKIWMAEHIVSTNAEGMVLRRLDAPYRQGEARQHYKVKLVKTLDAVVMGYNKEGKDSVELGLYDKNGILRRICGASLIGKGPRIVPGSVCEIFYLYGTRDLHVVQPRIVQVRDDKDPRACTLDQIIINRDHA
jgi:bifunctional non-homologous end joining protein LigD